MDVQIRIPFHILKNTFDFASTLSTIEPSNASVNPSDSMTIKIKCIISWSTEEKEEVILLENCINFTVYSLKGTCYAFRITWFHGLSLVIISPELVIHKEVCFCPVGNSCINCLNIAWEPVI